MGRCKSSSRDLGLCSRDRWPAQPDAAPGVMGIREVTSSMTPAFDVDPSDCSGALARLAAIGFSEASVSDRLGLADLNDLQVRAIPIYRQERLRERDLLASAIDLFLLQGAVLKAEVDQLFDPSAQEALGRAGILEADGEQVRARISLYPVGSELIFSDHACPQLERDGSSTVPHDQVMYVGTDSRGLSRMTQRNASGPPL